MKKFNIYFFRLFCALLLCISASWSITLGRGLRCIIPSDNFSVSDKSGVEKQELQGILGTEIELILVLSRLDNGYAIAEIGTSLQRVITVANKNEMALDKEDRQEFDSILFENNQLRMIWTDSHTIGVLPGFKFDDEYASHKNIPAGKEPWLIAGTLGDVYQAKYSSSKGDIINVEIKAREEPYLCTVFAAKDIKDSWRNPSRQLMLK